MVPPTLLLSTPILDLLRPHLAEAYRVVGLWEASAAEAATARAIVVGGHEPLPPGLFETCPGLGLIACFTAGYERLDLEAARARGVLVSHAREVNQVDVADHALGLIIASRRRIVHEDRLLRREGWLSWNRPGTLRLSHSLRGAKVGIVGLGAIGGALAVRCAALGMVVRWWGPREREAEWPRAATLLELAEWCDVLAVCARADESNHGLISREVLAAVGREGLFVNVARGRLVDEDALIELLRAGRLGGAALDVFDPEPTTAERWEGVENAVVTPHTAGATVEAIQALVDQVRLNLARFFAGEALATPAPEMLRGG